MVTPLAPLLRGRSAPVRGYLCPAFRKINAFHCVQEYHVVQIINDVDTVLLVLLPWIKLTYTPT